MDLDDSGPDKEFFTFADLKKTCLLSFTPEELERLRQKKAQPTNPSREEEIETLHDRSAHAEVSRALPDTSPDFSKSVDTKDRGNAMEKMPQELNAVSEVTALGTAVEEMPREINVISEAAEGRYIRPAVSRSRLNSRAPGIQEPPASPVNAVALTCIEGEYYMATGTDDGTAKIWFVSHGELIHLLRGHRHGVLAVAFSNPECDVEMLVATGSADSTAKLWSMSSGQLLHTLQGHHGWVRSIAFSPQPFSSKFWVVTGSDQGSSRESGGAAKLWKVTASEGELSSSFDLQCVSCTAFGPRLFSGMVLLAIASVGNAPCSQEEAAHSSKSETQVWNVAPLEHLKTFTGHKDSITGVAFGPTNCTDNSTLFEDLLLATCSWDKTVQVWKVQSGELHHTLYEHQDVVSSVSFAPQWQDGTILLGTGSWDGTAKLWSLPSGSLVRTFEAHKDWVTSVALQQFGQAHTFFAAGCRDRSVSVYCISIVEHRVGSYLFRRFEARERAMCCGWNCTLL